MIHLPIHTDGRDRPQCGGMKDEDDFSQIESKVDCPRCREIISKHRINRLPDALRDPAPETGPNCTISSAASRCTQCGKAFRYIVDDACSNKPRISRAPRNADRAMKKSKGAYTSKEVREILFNQMRRLAAHWSEEPTIQMHKDAFPTIQSRMEGLCFSILSMLDGSGMALPQIDLVLRPHSEDKAFHIKNGEKYFEDGMILTETPLHESFHH